MSSPDRQERFDGRSTVIDGIENPYGTIDYSKAKQSAEFKEVAVGEFQPADPKGEDVVVKTCHLCKHLYSQDPDVNGPPWCSLHKTLNPVRCDDYQPAQEPREGGEDTVPRDVYNAEVDAWELAMNQRNAADLKVKELQVKVEEQEATIAELQKEISDRDAQIDDAIKRGREFSEYIKGLR